MMTSLSLQCFLVKDDDVVQLMHWGKDIMALHNKKKAKNSQKGHANIGFMVIPEQKPNDDHEFVIQGSYKPNNRLRGMPRHLLQKCALPEDYSLAGGVIVYFLAH